MDLTTEEVTCKLTDGCHWIMARFHNKNRPLFESNRFQEAEIVRIIQSNIDEDNILLIVSLNLLHILCISYCYIIRIAWSELTGLLSYPKECSVENTMLRN